jgi:soluble lytic murein transglycosylase-like protein
MRCFARAVLAVVLILLSYAVLFSLAVLSTNAQAQGLVPRDAARHRLALAREAHRVWGLDGPVAAFAAQIHQESRWNPNAVSPVGAQGLTQFMPATAQWIGGLDGELAARAPLNPIWAIRALVVYDRWLWDRVKADDDCERLAFSLQAYNSGLGWVYKRQRRSPTPGTCLGAACAINPGVAPASQREAEHYPRVILLQHQPLYRTWGPGVCV